MRLVRVHGGPGEFWQALLGALLSAQLAAEAFLYRRLPCCTHTLTLTPTATHPCAPCTTQAPAVRGAAAANLGELTSLSARLDALMSDLATSAASATEPGLAVASLQALRGGLGASGARCAPATLDKVWASLGGLLRGEGPVAAQEEVRPAVASALGALAAHAPPPRLREILEAGPLGALATGGPGPRTGAAMALAAVARGAGAQLRDAGLLTACAEAAARFVKDKEVRAHGGGGCWGRAACAGCSQ